MGDDKRRITASQWLAAGLTFGIFLFGYVANVHAADVARISAIEIRVAKLDRQFGILLQKENDLIDALNGKHISPISPQG